MAAKINVSEQLGHSNIAITGDLYTHVAPSVRREAFNKLDTLLAPFVKSMQAKA